MDSYLNHSPKKEIHVRHSMMNIHLDLFHTPFLPFLYMLKYAENSKKLIVKAKNVRNRATCQTKNKTYKSVLQWNREKFFTW